MEVLMVFAVPVVVFTLVVVLVVVSCVIISLH